LFEARLGRAHLLSAATAQHLGERLLGRGERRPGLLGSGASLVALPGRRGAARDQRLYPSAVGLRKVEGGLGGADVSPRCLDVLASGAGHEKVNLRASLIAFARCTVSL
jgi:hypothetical protein